VLPNQLFITKEAVQIMKMHDSVLVYEAEDSNGPAPGQNKRLIRRYVEWLKLSAGQVKAKSPANGRHFMDDLIGIKKHVSIFKPIGWGAELKEYTFFGIPANVLEFGPLGLHPTFIIDKWPGRTELTFGAFYNLFTRRLKRLGLSPNFLRAPRNSDALDILSGLDAPQAKFTVPSIAGPAFPEHVLSWARAYVAGKKKPGQNIFSQNVVVLINHGLLPMQDFVGLLNEDCQRPTYKQLRAEIDVLCAYNYLYIMSGPEKVDHAPPDGPPNLSMAQVLEAAKKGPSKATFIQATGNIPWMTKWMAQGILGVIKDPQQS